MYIKYSLQNGDNLFVVKRQGPDPYIYATG